MTDSQYIKIMDAINYAIGEFYYRHYDREDLLIYMPEHIKDLLVMENFRQTRHRIKGDKLEIFGVPVVNGYEQLIIVASANDSRKGIRTTKISLTGQLPIYKAS